MTRSLAALLLPALLGAPALAKPRPAPAVAGAAVASDPKGAALHNQRALSAYSQQRYDEAIAAWRQAYALDPSPQKLLNIATAQRKAARTQESIATYERLLAETPTTEYREDVERHLGDLRAKLDEDRGAKLLADGQHDEAIDALRSSYRIRAAPRVLFQLAEAQRLSGKTAEAIDTYRRCVQSDLTGPMKADAERRLAELSSQREEDRARALTTGHQYEQAALAMEEAYRQGPQIRLLLPLGQALRRAGRPRDALRVLERCVDEGPQGPDRAAAEEELREARALVEEERGAALLSRGENARAVVVLEGACKIKPLPGALLKLGQAQRLVGQPEQALATFRQVLGRRDGVSAGERLEAGAAAQDLDEVLALRREVERSRHPPVYKRAWFWGVMAVVVAGAGAGIGAALGLQRVDTRDLGTDLGFQKVPQ